MTPAAYVPDEGAIIWLSFTPQSGHEQAGRRPAVVLSPKAYNSRTGLMACVPATAAELMEIKSKIKTLLKLG